MKPLKVQVLAWESALRILIVVSLGAESQVMCPTGLMVVEEHQWNFALP
jgi:hypothetical protein